MLAHGRNLCPLYGGAHSTPEPSRGKRRGKPSKSILQPPTCMRIRYHEEVLGFPEGFPFSPQYGFLVADTLHHPFDRGEWALWPDGENLVVRFFYPSKALDRSYHGKLIALLRFRGAPEGRPNRKMLLFHYQQPKKNIAQVQVTGVGGLSIVGETVLVGETVAIRTHVFSPIVSFDRA
ncbi:hypothetical protein K437DRAFT_58544 [Tilletiaria anomala UBC 951]|uniref:Uncharacterized protein n=1 Tax=Tilletiaria anomala (strain ATCC 24038 / CBS 436.72 / UBC 951) TaxID=1037660 RepID=A0A066V478_TILAU|nr:uncharacterized protein K437DRAFT_58544 [Tilletiaria anomala UBC 951]KDN36246.1 hypothetical protein K437DRAFT_58544 [Tilletiaria anomala UBC 951]